MLPAAPVDPADPSLVDACGSDPNTVCQWVWERTGNEGLTSAANWFIGKPLEVLLILLVAWIVSRVARRAIRRGIYGIVVTDRQTATRALMKVGSTLGTESVGEEGTSDATEIPRRAARATSISTVIASTVTVLIWVIALFLVLGELGIDLAPLIAGAGIAGVALGFGAQNVVKDCLAGLFMLIEDQFGIGDVVDLGEASGTVERITLRTTVLRGLDGTVWHVPNGQVVRVGNQSQLWSVAVVDAAVAYAADVAKASRILERTAGEVVEHTDFAGDVLEAPQLLGVESASGDGVILRMTVKTTPGAQFRLQRALRQSVKQAFDEAGIPGPPPRSNWPPSTA
ncbi:MAG: mechanosensitive ion channel family protein [Ilumatobacteraceae bacterium]